MLGGRSIFLDSVEKETNNIYLSRPDVGGKILFTKLSQLNVYHSHFLRYDLGNNICGAKQLDD